MTNLDIIKEKLYNKQASLIVMFEDGTIEEYYNPRIKDIVSILRENKEALKDAIVADKVIGKVVASLLTVAGVKELYADVISELAVPVLEKNKVKYDYKNKVEYIINNEKTGMCPMENKFKDERDLKKIYDYFVNDKKK